MFVRGRKRERGEREKSSRKGERERGERKKGSEKEPLCECVYLIEREGQREREGEKEMI